jgi:hypothetical protein
MEPITAAIVTALSAGGAFVLDKTATEFIKDVYGRLKDRIEERFPDTRAGIEALVTEPTSTALQVVVEESLERERASYDIELRKLAKLLADLILDQPSEKAAAIGVDLGKLLRAKVTFADVTAADGATGVKIAEATDSILQFGNVTASNQSKSGKKA